MTNDTERPGWWELHLRHARGEPLSAAEQQQYAAELARHDREPDLASNLATLKQLRAELATWTQENAQLRSRIASLEQEIHAAEQKLKPQTRKLLGVGE
jgi:cell division protein FtsB